jgi:hypothetical protein
MLQPRAYALCWMSLLLPLRAGADCVRGIGKKVGWPRLVACALWFPDRAARHSPTDPVDFLRKEVMQPQVPLRLPCYDLVPITKFAFGAALLAVGLTTSGALSFRGLTGGVYKAQEHIHRGVADPRLLAIPTSCRRVAACNPN